MQQQSGRNDPCPCGSGKKYKKCCMGKENVVQFKELKRERFLQKKMSLQERMRSFLDMQTSFSERNRLMNQFKRRMDCNLGEEPMELFFIIWSSFFHFYENGKRGVEWFFEHEQRRFDSEEWKLARQWTTLRPSVIQAVNKNEEGAWVEDYFSKERYFLPFVELFTDVAPWNTTFCMIEPSNGDYFIHGGSSWLGPEVLKPLSEKINLLIEETRDPCEQVVMDYFPEIFSVLFKDPLADWRKHENETEIEDTTLFYHMNDKEKVVDELFDHPDLVVEEWENGQGSFDWIDRWFRYDDNEAPDPVYLGHEKGTVQVEGDRISFHTVNSKDVEMFQSWIGDLSNAVAFEKKDVETIEMPRRIEVQTLRVQISENTPSYFSSFGQSRFQQDFDRPIPMFGDRSPKELVQNGEEENVDLWLKQQEYNSYFQLQKEFDNPAHTEDFNFARKALDLPPSPFVTGGETRQSSIRRCDSPLQRPNRVKRKDIPYYKALGLTPDTKDEFFARDVVDFFKEKTIGKSKGTVQKYETSLSILVEYFIEDAPSDVSSWDECDVLVWEQLMAYDYLASYDDVSVYQAQSLFSTLKALAKWLDRKYELDLAAVVKPLVSKFEGPVCDAIRLLDCYAPYYYRTSNDVALKDLAMLLKQRVYPDKQYTEGYFQVAGIETSGVKVKDLDNLAGKKHTLKLRPNEIELIHPGMILNATLSRPKVGGWEIFDLGEVFPREALDYLVD